MSKPRRLAAAIRGVTLVSAALAAPAALALDLNVSGFIRQEMAYKISDDEKKFLLDGLDVDVVLWNGNAIGVTLPAHVTVQITHSEPGVKGDTASNVTKPATISTGATIQVPLFVNEGEWVKVDTRTGDYLERVNRR